MKHSLKGLSSFNDNNRVWLAFSLSFNIVLLILLMFTSKLPWTENEIEIVKQASNAVKIILSDENVPTRLDDEEGTVYQAYPTVEEIDSPLNLTNCEDEECGLGKFIYAPTKTADEFKNYTLGGCFDTDGYYSAQCWDLGDTFWQNYAGRRLSTCSTGKAKGIWNCKEQVAGDDFTLITDKSKLQKGDWLIFNYGEFGHIGMALGKPSNGYIALLGQNQGGESCDGTKIGGATNIINISLKSFTGAFRPKIYESSSSKKKYYTVKKGDNLTKIAKKFNKTVKKLVKWNKIKNANLIRVGQKLRVA